MHTASAAIPAKPLQSSLAAPEKKMRRWTNQFTADFLAACEIKRFSEEEFHRAFDRLDVYGDGHIDVADVRSLVQQISVHHGGITNEEETAFAMAFMKHFDTDLDGVVTWPEFRDCVQEMAEEIDPRVWPIAVTTLVVGVAVGAIFPVMPLFAQDLGIQPGTFGMIVSAMGLGRLLSNIPMAVFAEQYGRRPSMILGWTGTAMSMAMLGCATSAGQLVTARLLAGICTSAQNTGSQLYLNDISNMQNRARSYAPLMAAWSAGAAVGPFIGGFLTDQYGFRYAFFFCSAAMGTIACVNSFYLPETKKPDPTAASKGIAVAFQEAMAAWRPLMAQQDFRCIFMVACASWFAMVGAQFTLLPMLAYTQVGMTASSIGTIFGLQALINVAMSQPSAWLSDKVGRKPPIVVGMFLMAVSICCLPLASTPMQLTLIASLPLPLGTSLLGTAPMAYVTDITTEATRAQALALLRTAQDVGFLAGGFILGAIAQMTSIAVAMSATSVCLVATLTIFALRARETVEAKSMGGHRRRVD